MADNEDNFMSFATIGKTFNDASDYRSVHMDNVKNNVGAAVTCLLGAGLSAAITAVHPIAGLLRVRFF